MKKETIKDIKTVIKHLCNAASVADDLSENLDLSKADQRKFRHLYTHLQSEWIALFEYYREEIESEKQNNGREIH